MNSSASAVGTIFNVQGYSIHDGPGIRTTVFLKGCPLTCLWCQNPESQRKAPEIFFDSDKCAGCGKCVAVCPQTAIRLVDGKSRTDRSRCDSQGLCISACPSDARTMMGRQACARDIFEEVAADAIFYTRSGGGITLSGGEPLAQAGFAAELLERCKQAGFHTALDTSGYARWDVARSVLKHVDLVLYDFKHMDSSQHKRLTGVPNELILENAKRIHHELPIAMWARIPVIPGYNDSRKNIEATARFIATQLSTAIPVNLNPYHSFGDSKRDRLEWQRKSFDSYRPSDEHMQAIAEMFRAQGLTVSIGG